MDRGFLAELLTSLAAKNPRATMKAPITVEDVLVRRTRLFIESADSGAAVAADVAAIMGRLLGWNRRRRAAETRRYLDPVQVERAGRATDSVPAPLRALAG